MQNRIYILIFFHALLYHLQAQDKHDHTWLLGYPPNKPELLFGGSYIDFNTGNPMVSFFDAPFDFSSPTIMSDDDGKLLFYTSGCSVANWQHHLMDNGVQINAGSTHDIYCTHGYPAFQSLTALPYPGKPNRYILVHLRRESGLVNTTLMYSDIDMAANNGFGKVIEKNQPLLTDTLSVVTSATRHANGRDWWIVVSKNESSKYYTFLLDPNGIHGPNVQNVQQGWVQGHQIGYSCTFSPDGSKFVRTGGDVPALFMLFDFDRCNGMLSNPQHIAIPDTSAFDPWPCFSPNSKYLYLANAFENLYQYDVAAPDISASVQLVAQYDGFVDIYGGSTNFFCMTMGPDQRIYTSCGGAVNYLNVINRPNLSGVGCDVRQHSVTLPSHNQFLLPNTPNYRLYDLPGSPCDTLGINAPMWAWWRVEPDSLANPLERHFFDLSYYQPTAWHWDFGDGSISTEQHPAHVFPAAGTYNVCLIASSAMGVDTLCKEVVIPLVIGTDEPGRDRIWVSLWPNPADEVINMRFGAAFTGEVRVIDLVGKQVIWRDGLKSVQSIELDVSHLSTGMYQMQALTNGRVLATKKFIVIR